MKGSYIRRFSVLALAGASLLASKAQAQNVETAGAPPDERATSYVLAPNDLVSIRVFQEDDLESKLRVAKDGTISFPLIGSVRIGGKTPSDAARTIRDALARGYLINPQVTVSVLAYTKYRVTILGQVQKPGSYDFPDRDRLTLLEAIGLAGGYTRGADPSKVLVKRVSNGEETVYQLNAKSMASREATKEFEVVPGDVVTVKESMF